MKPILRRASDSVRWRTQVLRDPGLRANLRQQHLRLSSFPFISGDTYRSLASHIIESSADLERFQSADVNSGVVVFSSVHMSSQVVVELPDPVAAQTTLLIHNGDIIDASLIGANASRFHRIASVNWLGDRNLVTPLPIGLENSAFCVNGRLEWFADATPGQRANGCLKSERVHDVLLSFKDSNNLGERTQARLTFEASGLDLTSATGLTPRKYQSELRQHRFVISPPGNGPDCHRTWEALYSGTVPIVLRSAWSFGHKRWPVLVVNSWDEAVQRIRQQGAASLYTEIMQSSSSDFFAVDFLRELP